MFLYRTNLLRVLVSYLDKERDPASIYHEATSKLTIPTGKALICVEIKPNLNAIKQMQEWRQPRVDGVEGTRH